MEPAAEMIVHSARGHFAQREQVHFQRVLCLRRSSDRAHGTREKKIQRDRPRKFRRAAEAAFVRIIAARDLLDRPLQITGVDLLAARVGAAGLRFAQRRDDLGPLLRDLLAFLSSRRRAIRSSTFLKPGCP